MIAYVRKYRKSMIMVFGTFCLLYSSSITLDLISRIRSRERCRREGESLQRMVRHVSNSDRPADSTDGSRQSEYRLDMIRADIKAYQDGHEINEEFDLVDDKTDYFGCKDLNRIPRTRREVEENLRGNRGISFLKVRIDGVTIPVVMKEANRLYRTVIEQYKYNSAKREVMYLTKLRGLRGVPRLFGSCIEDIRIRYIVERVDGFTLCNDNGTTNACATGEHVLDLLKQDPNPPLAAMAFAYSTTTFLQQLADVFNQLVRWSLLNDARDPGAAIHSRLSGRGSFAEDRHLFMEDISGLNFMVSHNWQLFMVDADSLVFYNDSRIFAHVSCSMDEHCPVLSGNLWADISLNKKIYKKCRDLSGICEDQECRGYGTELHTCGIGHWYICRILRYFKYDNGVDQLLSEVCDCMIKTYPHERCTFREASKLLREALQKFLLSNGYSILT